MLFVFNKQKIYTYLISIVMILFLFYAVSSINSKYSIKTSSPELVYKDNCAIDNNGTQTRNK